VFDTFLYGTGGLLLLAKLLDVPAVVAVPTTLAAVLAVSLDLSWALSEVDAAASDERARQKNRAPEEE
jgi:hypothetical protein